MPQKAVPSSIGRYSGSLAGPSPPLRVPANATWMLFETDVVWPGRIGAEWIHVHRVGTVVLILVIMAIFMLVRRGA
jgi:hypothetical protein